jgi:putative addiction module component (TIGR02574 family)
MLATMSRAVRELYEEASGLPPNDRAELAGLLLESLEDQSASGTEEAWAREIERRMADYRSGRVKTLSWQEVRAHLHRSDR